MNHFFIQERNAVIKVSSKRWQSLMWIGQSYGLVEDSIFREFGVGVWNRTKLSPRYSMGFHKIMDMIGCHGVVQND